MSCDIKVMSWAKADIKITANTLYWSNSTSMIDVVNVRQDSTSKNFQMLNVSKSTNNENNPVLIKLCRE